MGFILQSTTQVRRSGKYGAMFAKGSVFDHRIVFIDNALAYKIVFNVQFSANEFTMKNLASMEEFMYS